MLIRISVLVLTFIIFSCSKEIIQQKLTVNWTPLNGGTVSPPSNAYEKGSVVSLTATPAGEYVFKQWSGNLSGTNNPAPITMDTDKQVTGVFEKRQYPLSLTIEGSGTVKEEVIAIASQAQYPSGTTVRLTAQPADKFEFGGWSGDLISTSNPLDLKVDKPISLKAKFGLSKFAANKYVEKHSQINQTTGWFQTNKSFVGNFWIDSSLVVRNIFVDASGGYQFGNYIPNIQSYFSNRQTLLYADFNGDNKNEVFNNYWAAPFGKDIPGYYALWEFDKSGFSSPKVAKGLTAARKLTINDYFGDGKMSILVSSSGSDAPPFPGDYVQIVSFDSQLNIKLKDINEVKGYYHTGASGDVDNDGDIDLLMYSGGGQSKMGPVYFENRGNGDFKYNANLISGLNYINNNPNNYYCIELFDINNDGFLDIILGGGGTDVSNRILWGSSSHIFSTLNQTILPKQFNFSSVMDIAFSDIDIDGDIDILILSEINYQGFGVQIIENQKDKFVDVSSTRMDVTFSKNTLWISWLRLFDIDFDGDYDLIGDGFGYKDLDKLPAEKQPVPQVYWINDGKGFYKGSFKF
jgi:hypothetical protein